MNTHFYLIITPQHTGTWFWLNFLTRHPEVDGFAVRSNFLQGIEGFDRILSGGIEIDKDKDLSKEVQYRMGYKSVIHFHGPDSPEHLMLIATAYPLLTTRDPLLSLISRFQRFPAKEDSNILDTFIWMAKYLSRFSPHLYKIVSIDIIDMENRIPVLKSVLNWFNLTIDEDYIRRWVDRWPKIPTLEYELKEKYNDGDIEFLQRAMPNLWDSLIRQEGLLRPWLESIGYKDLLWWNQ